MILSRRKLKQLLKETALSLGSFGDPTRYLVRIMAKQAHTSPGLINGFIVENIYSYNFKNKAFFSNILSRKIKCSNRYLNRISNQRLK